MKNPADGDTAVWQRDLHNVAFLDHSYLPQDTRAAQCLEYEPSCRRVRVEGEDRVAPFSLEFMLIVVDRLTSLVGSGRNRSPI
jgi:hypothetical protein